MWTILGSKLNRGHIQLISTCLKFTDINSSKLKEVKKFLVIPLKRREHCRSTSAKRTGIKKEKDILGLTEN